MDSDATVKVAVRIRPLLEHELSQQCSVCVAVAPGVPQVVVGSDQNFTFDYVYGVSQRQEEVMEECVVPLVDALFEGFNATILAYGQTGSGKTYTMGSASSKRLAGETLGIIPRAIQTMFDTISEREERDHNCTFRIRVQFLEIYGEEIRDLLDPASSSKVSIRETAGGSVYVSGAREELVTSTEESMMALEKGSMSRMTASTRMNETSSRSHGIFTVVLEQTLHSRPAESAAANSGPIIKLIAPDGDANAPPASLGVDTDTAPSVDFNASRTEPEVRKCKFHFVDLAGSERVKRTGAEGLRLKEGIDINKGLLVLGNVISALGDEQKRGKVHVPYRDSKLTRMLQDSLGGNSKTLMICCVSPADSNYYETLNALKYANRARNIQNKPRVNIDPTVQLLGELRKHVQCLATEVLWWRAALGSEAPPSNPSTASLQAVPFVITSDLLHNLASSVGGSTKLLMSHSVAPQSVSAATKSPMNSKNLHSTNATGSSAAPIALPSAASVTDTLAARKAALEYESTIFSLKQKLSTAESEVHRLTEVSRRHRQHLSDTLEANSFLQSERDFYKMKLRDVGVAPLGDDGPSFRDDFVSEQPENIAVDSVHYCTAEEIVNGSSASVDKKDVHVVVELLSRYVSEINALKEKKYSSNQSQDNFVENESNSNPLDVSTVTAKILEHEPLGDSLFDSNVTMLENDLTSSVARVISQTQKELRLGQQRLSALKNSVSEMHNDEAFAGLGAGTGGFEEAQDGGDDFQSGNEVEAEDRAFRRRQQDMSSEVVGLSNSIQLKEQLLLQLQRSQRQYEMMKLFYENKLISLSEAVNQAELEKQKVLTELENLALRTDRTADMEEQLTSKLREKDNELRSLLKKQKELTHHSQVQSRSLNQISKLESEIEHMKRSRVDLTKQIHIEKKRHLAALNLKAREIEKLKAELNKTSAEIKKVSKEKERAENRTREALKEGADLRRKVHEISKVGTAVASDSALSSAKLSKKSSARQMTTGTINSYKPAGKRLLTEDEIKTKRYLDKALQKISERERAADSLRQQYEQQLALMNQKKQLETSRSSLRELITHGDSADTSSVSLESMSAHSRPLTAAEEDALAEVEERIQNLEGQIISRKVRIQNMQTEFAESGRKGSCDSTVEYLQKKSADSLPAAHELLRLLFDMLVFSKVSIKKTTEQVEVLKEKERNLRELLEDEAARLLSLQFAHDQEITRIHSEYEEKLTGLLNFSDVSQLLNHRHSSDDIVESYSEADRRCTELSLPSEHHDRRYSRLLQAASAEIRSFDDCGKASEMRTRSDSGTLSTKDSEFPDSQLLKGNQGKVRALLALSHEKNNFLANALARETHRVLQLQSDLNEAELRLKQSSAMSESKDFDITFLNEECRMLRDLVDEYKERVLSLEGGQGFGIVRTIDQLDKQIRDEKGMVIRYGDNPDNEEELDSPLPQKRVALIEAHGAILGSGGAEKSLVFQADKKDDGSDGENSEDFGVLTDEILKSGNLNLHNESGNGHNISIFDRLANPSYFTGTQKKLFQKDLESKRALVKKIKNKDDVCRKKRDGGVFRSLSDDESSSHPQKDKDDSDDKSGDERDGPDVKQETSAKKLIRRSSFSTDDLDIGTTRAAASVSRPVDFPLQSANSFESTGAASATSFTPGGDVFSRLLNPTKFTGIHKASGLALHSVTNRSTSPVPSPRTGPADPPDSPRTSGKSLKSKGLVTKRRGSGHKQQFHV